MMIPVDLLSSRDQKALKWGICSVGLLLLVTRGLPFVRDWREGIVDSAASQVATWDASRQKLERLPELLDSLEHRRDRLAELPPFLVLGRTYASGSANLVAHLAGLASSVDVRLGSTSVAVDTTNLGAFAVLTARAEASGSSSAIIRMIENLETGAPALSLVEWSLARRSPLGFSAEPEELKLNFTAVGLMIRAGGAE